MVSIIKDGGSVSPVRGDPDIKTLGGAIDPAGCVRYHPQTSQTLVCLHAVCMGPYVRPKACASQARWGHGVHLEAQWSPSGVRWVFDGENNTTRLSV